MEDICKICHSGTEESTLLITPCLCLGSVKYVHQHCLLQWIRISAESSCELCKYTFKIESKVKPICQWEMTTFEKMDLFLALAISVPFSLYCCNAAALEFNGLVVTAWKAPPENVFVLLCFIICLPLLIFILLLFLWLFIFRRIFKKWISNNTILTVREVKHK